MTGFKNHRKLRWCIWDAIDWAVASHQFYLHLHYLLGFFRQPLWRFNQLSGSTWRTGAQMQPYTHIVTMVDQTPKQTRDGSCGSGGGLGGGKHITRPLSPLRPHPVLPDSGSQRGWVMERRPGARGQGGGCGDARGRAGGGGRGSGDAGGGEGTAKRRGVGGWGRRRACPKLHTRQPGR